jgi:hypothetical protein
MKNYLILLSALLLTASSFAQVGINTETPDASAELDIVSTIGGILIPRLTESQRDLISTPATGLLIYQTDQTAGFYFYNGGSWTKLDGAEGPQGPDGNTILNGVNDPTTEGNDGDFYINTSTTTLFGPRTAGVWGAGIALAANSGANSKRNCNSYILPYMPYSSTSGQIIYVTRVPSAWVGGVGANTGAITAEAIDESGDIWNLGEIGTAGMGVTKITNNINTALQNVGFEDGKVSLRISVANPENIYMYASYNAGSVRGFVDVECQRD